MNYWKGLGKFVGKIIGGLLVILGIFQWGVKLKVSTWVIPDWIILLLLALALAVMGYTAYFVGRNAKPGTGEKPKKPKIRLDQDELFILVGLSLHKEQTLLRDDLRKLFLDKLKGKNDADFNISVNKLRNFGLIRVSGDYISGQEYLEILSPGLEYLDQLREK